MTFPVRFVTIAICLTFVVCALVRETMPLAGKMIDLRVLETIRDIRKGTVEPERFKL